MHSQTDLREAVDGVIGVDTHVHTHCAAVVDAATGGVLDEITVEATAEGYAELVEFAGNHARGSFAPAGLAEMSPTVARERANRGR